MSDHESIECLGCTEYRELSRRNFMAVTGGVTMAALSAPSWLPRVAVAKDHRGTQRDVMVAIYLRGASDGLTLCVPWGENAYYTNRPTLNIPRPDSADPNRATDLDGFFGLPPAMSPLLPAYQAGKLLIVHACGSTDTSRSHFDAQRLMEVGVAGVTYTSGWLGRHLYSVAPMDPNAILRAVGISTGLQRSLQGGPSTLPIPDLDNFGLSGSSTTNAERRGALSDMYAVVPDPVHAAAENTLATIDLLNTINFAGYVPAGSAAYPAGGFGLALKSTAALIKAQVGVEAVAIDVSGWDTHINQGPISGGMATLMSTLAAGVGAFYTDMTTGTAPTFVLVAMSEFGRRLAENGSLGTDHGHGNALFVMGNCIAGGQVMRQWPGLSPGQLYQGRDLQVTIDYRDILAEIIQQRLGNTNLDYVFPGYTPTDRAAVAC
jgi:uncharacterized protein (DUF1501 family)